jgi:hypothetical protein
MWLKQINHECYKQGKYKHNIKSKYQNVRRKMGDETADVILKHIIYST